MRAAPASSVLLLESFSDPGGSTFEEVFSPPHATTPTEKIIIETKFFIC